MEQMLKNLFMMIYYRRLREVVIAHPMRARMRVESKAADVLFKYKVRLSYIACIAELCVLMGSEIKMLEKKVVSYVGMFENTFDRTNFRKLPLFLILCLTLSILCI